MTKQGPFINRENELKQIDTYIKEQDSYRVVCIKGDGGIGKTRLLQEVYSLYSSRHNDLRVTRIIDFDNLALHSPENLAFTMAERIGLEHFENYIQSLSDYRKFRRVGVSQERLQEERNRVTDTWSSDFNKYSARQRVVYLFDTYDALVKARGTVDYIQNYLSAKKISNVIFLIAGRNSDELHAHLLSRLDTVQLIELKRLEPKSAEIFLEQQKDLLRLSVDPNLDPKILFLADGKPILITLAVEWCGRELPLDWLINDSLEKLRSLSPEELKERKQEFECHLVIKIGQNRDESDSLIQMMSRVYPLNIELITKLLGYSETEAINLFNRVKDYVFIKSLPDGGLSLHDEMRRMINAYVWPQVDPHEEQRRHDSKIAADYFAVEIESLERQLDKQEKEDFTSLLRIQEVSERLEIATLNWIEHAFYADLVSGFDIYQKKIQGLRRLHKIGFVNQLQSIAQNYAHAFSEEQRYNFEVLRGRLLYDEGKADEAKQLFEQLLNEHRGNSKHEANIYNALAVSEVKLGEFDAALEHQKKCLELNIALRQFVPVSANYLGYIYRLRGEWDNAIGYYQEAFEAALAEDTPNQGEVADILNNLGYVLGLEGRYDEAKNYCQEAIDTWQELRREKDVARGQITLATIYRDEGKYDKAVVHLEQALTHIEEPDDSESLVRAYFHLGWTQWFKGAGKNDKILLKKARQSFEKSLELARNYHILTELPGILHQSSNVYWLLGEKDKARRINEEAYLLSQQMHDVRYAVDSLVGKAEFDYEDGIYDTIKSYADELWKRYESKEYPYPLFYGRMRRIQADVSYEQGNYEEALQGYAKAIEQITQHGGYGMYFIDRELMRLTEKLGKLPSSVAHTWLVYLKDYWSKQEPVNKSAVLVSWCNKQLVKIKRHSKTA